MILRSLLILLITVTTNTVSIGQHFVSQKEIKAHNIWLTLKECQSKLLNKELAYRLAVDRSYLLSEEKAEDIVDSDTIVLVYSYENNKYNELLAGKETIFEYSRIIVDEKVYLDTLSSPINQSIFDNIQSYLYKNKATAINLVLQPSQHIHAIIIFKILSGEDTDDGLDRSRIIHCIF